MIQIAHIRALGRGHRLDWELSFGQDMNHQVIIIGAGPTGLLLANLLGHRGITTLVLERGAGMRAQSRAIGVTPPSLEILESIGLADAFITRGLPIRTAVVHGSKRVLGVVDFAPAHEKFGFVLSIPQDRTWKILVEQTDCYDGVELRFNTEAVFVQQDAHGVAVSTADGELLRASFVVSADGANGKIAVAAGLNRCSGSYAPRFFMADLADESPLGAKAHLWFTATGAVESFPLPDNVRRWIVQVPSYHQPGVDGNLLDDLDIESVVRTRTGIALKRSDRIWTSSFQPSWSEISRFSNGRVLVAGDAAHTMSPIGGQGMNTGFADAELLAFTLEELLRGTTAHVAGIHRTYHRARRRASRSATRRAWMGMTVGTMTGSWGDRIRATLLRIGLHGAGARWAARHFAMQSIPMRRANLALQQRRLFQPGYSKKPQKEIT